MKHISKITWVLFVATALLASCKKDPVNQGGTKSTPITSTRGTTTGAAATKTIGAAGGDLTSADGRITLSVPAGAVSSNTTFSIQPIKNTLDTNNAKPGYRLLPEGVNFSKPVQLVFHYDDLDLKGTGENYLRIAWQRPDGSWKAEPTSLNKAGKTVTVSTMHFSDWTVTGEFTLVSTYKTLAAGESTTVSIIGVNEDDLMAPLVQSEWNGVITNVRNWRKTAGPGDLSNVDGSTAHNEQRKYTAPASLSAPAKAVIEVTIDGNISIPDSTAPGGKRNFQNMILLTEIDLVANVYMIGTFGPIDINIGDVTALYANGRINIAAHSANISVGFITNGALGTGFPSGDITIPGFSITNASYALSPTQSFSFGSSYQECNPTPTIKYSGGALTLQRWGNIGEPVEGQFSGLLYTSTGNGPNGCPTYDQRMLTVRFRAVRSL